MLPNRPQHPLQDRAQRQPSTLNIKSLPHIVKSIFSYAKDHSALLRRRQLSKSYREAIDAKLFETVEVKYLSDPANPLSKRVYLEHKGLRLPVYPVELEVTGDALHKVGLADTCEANGCDGPRGSDWVNEYATLPYPPNTRPCHRAVALRQTWARVLRHTIVLDDLRDPLEDPMPRVLRPYPTVAPPEFPPQLYEGRITLPALKVVRGCLSPINNLPAHTYVDVCHFPARPVWTPEMMLRTPPLGVRMHVILVKCDVSRTDELLIQAPVLPPFPETAQQLHLVIIFQAVNTHPGSGVVVSLWHTSLQTFLWAVEQVAHARYTLVGLDDLPPRIFGIRADSPRGLLQSCLKNPRLIEHMFLWVLVPPGITVQWGPQDPPFPGPANVPAERVSILTAQEWRDEIGEEAWQQQTSVDV